MALAKFLKLLRTLWKYNRMFRFAIIMGIGLLFRNMVYMRLYRKWHKLPHGPNGVPIAGVLPYAWSIGSEQYHAYVLPTYGKIVSYPTVMQQVMLINDPEVARKIYSNPTSWNRLEPFLQHVSNTITFLNGDTWFKRRKNIHSNLIATINSDEITKGSLAFLKNVVFPYLDKYDHNHLSDIRTILRPLTFNLVLYACVGKHIRSLDDKFFIEFDKLATKFWANFRSRMFISFLIGNGKLFQFCKPMFRLGELGENIRKDMVKLVVTYNNSSNIDNVRARKCFRDYVREEKLMSEEELFSDITSLLFPSIDTTSNMLGFCLYLLCKYPEKQEYIYENELKPVFHGRVENINLTESILLKIPYFRAFIFETLRIYPTTHVSAVRYLDNQDENKNTEPIKIEVNDNETYELGTSTVFSINTIGIGRNPKHWVKDSNIDDSKVDMMDVHFEFWLDENGAFKPNKSLTIFSLGRRQCIGKQVAIRNMYVVLIALMLKYKFSVKDPKNWKIPVENYALYAPGIADIQIEKRDENDIPVLISDTNLILTNGGYDEINGDFRWFAPESQWRLYKEDASYSIENNINVDDIYAQLHKLFAKNENFTWDNTVKKCWIISNTDRSAIYYAAPQLDNKYIPQNDCWISVHGSLPAPTISPNLLPTAFGSNSEITPKSKTSTSSLKPLPESIENDEEETESSLSPLSS